MPPANRTVSFQGRSFPAGKKPLVTFEFDGLEEFAEALALLPKHVENNVVRRSLAFAATPIVREVRRRAPVDEGVLDRDWETIRFDWQEA